MPSEIKSTPEGIPGCHDLSRNISEGSASPSNHYELSCRVLLSCTWRSQRISKLDFQGFGEREFPKWFRGSVNTLHACLSFPHSPKSPTHKKTTTRVSFVPPLFHSFKIRAFIFQSKYICFKLHRSHSHWVRSS